MADGKVLIRELRREFKAAAEPVRRQVQSNADFSRKIPGAVTVKTTFTKRNVGVSLRVNLKKAPGARAIENKGRQGTFRHPVFGTSRWVDQPAKPYLQDGFAPYLPEFEAATERALGAAARAAGFT